MVVELRKPLVDDDGGLDAEDVYIQMRATPLKQIDVCYRKAFALNPELRGRIDVTITIGRSGKPTAVEAEGFDDGVDACIEKAARTWKLARPPGGSATFTFPISCRRK